MRRFFVFALLLFISSVEAAKQSAIPNRFGAIAYHRASQSWGVSYDKARARDASLEALKQCGHRECEVVHKFKNGCAALADGAKAAAAASGATRDEAETKALRRCGAGCRPIAWACTR
jgi:ribosomal protein L12E/L44/L45/RPP1/RPP2